MSDADRTPRVLDRPKKGRVLVIAPHADDEVLGCGGTLALHAEQGDEIQVVVVFDGALGLPKGTDPALREAEAIAGGKHLGELAYEFWRYPEGHEPSPSDLAPAVARLADFIAKFEPATIYAPWLGDEHRDHRVVAEALRVACRANRSCCEIWGYEVWSQLEPAVVVDVTRVWPKKLAALREHRSQLAATDLEALMLATACKRGSRLASRDGFAEAFARFDSSSISPRRSFDIVYVSQLDASEFRGGTERVVRGHLEALSAMSHRATSIAGSELAHDGRDAIESDEPLSEFAERYPTLALAAGVHVVRIPRLASEPFDLALDRPRVRELVLRSIANADVVHVHHWSTLCGDLVRSIARTKPVVVTLHDFFSTCPRYFRRSPFPTIRCPIRGEITSCARCIEPEAGGRSIAELELALRERAANFEAEIAAARVVLAPSRALAERIAPLLGLDPARVRVLEHRMPSPRPRREVDATVRWPERTPLTVLHFGNLSRDKGTLDLVRALADLPSDSVALVLCGPTLDTELEVAIERERRELRIQRIGAYRDFELAAVARQSDVAAFPSRLIESYGLVVDEARELGLPTWVSDRGALPERIGRAGRVLPAEAPRTWTNAFEELLSRPAMLDEQRQALGRAAPRDFAATAIELEQIYRELLK